MSDLLHGCGQLSHGQGSAVRHRLGRRVTDLSSLNPGRWPLRRSRGDRGVWVEFPHLSPKGGLPMRTLVTTVLLSGLLLAPALATPKPERPPTVTLHCARMDLGEALHRIGLSLGRNVYIGPGVTGSVTADFDRYPAEKALGIVLRMQDTEYR